MRDARVRYIARDIDARNEKRFLRLTSLDFDSFSSHDIAGHPFIRQKLLTRSAACCYLYHVSPL